jgi:hypothetical protein
MIAIHFDAPGSLVPVQQGMNVLLIPMDRANIGNIQLEELDYLRLTREEAVQGNFYALLLMCKQ